MKHIRLDQCGSTNDEVRAAFDDGAQPPLLISAAKQSAGRGRSGRSWAQFKGNFAGSFLLPVPKALVSVPGGLALIAGLAIRDALIAHGQHPDAVQLKWPNDVLIDDRKVAGVLAEWLGPADRPVAIVGIGVNLAAAPGEGNARFPPTAAFGADAPAPERFADTLAGAVSAWLERAAPGAAPVFDAWRACAWRIGQSLTLTVGEERLSGIFRDIDEHGRLILRLASGHERHLSAGDATSR